MNRLTKDQIAELESLRNDLADAAAEYNSKRADLESYLSDLQSEARDYFDNKSEAWQNGDKGEAYAAWLESFEELPDECDESVPEYPEAPE